MDHLKTNVLLIALILCILFVPSAVASAEEEDCTLVLPAGLKQIEAEAFAGIPADAVIFPEGIEYIADDAFDRQSAGTGFGNLENSIAVAWCKGHGWFFVDTDADTVVFPDGIESVSDGAFPGILTGTGIGNAENTVAVQWCEDHGWFFADTDANTVIFPDGIESVADDAFPYILSGTGIGSAENTVAIQWCEDHGWTYQAYPRYFALIIGNWNYDYLSKLNGIDSDINAMQNAVSGLSQNWQVTVKSNLSAEGMLSAVSNKFSQAARETDVCLFYYSGHGDNSKSATAGSLFGTDGKGSGNENAAQSGYVLPSALCSAIDSATPGKVIVILDSCGSGSSIYDESSGTKGGAAVGSNFTRAVVNAFRGKTALNDTKSGEMLGKYVVLAACEHGTTSKSSYVDQQALEAYLATDLSNYNMLFNHGSAFTYSLVRTMGCGYPSGSYSGEMAGDSNSDGKLSLSEAYQGVRNQVDNMNQLVNEAWRAYCEANNFEFQEGAYYEQAVQMSGPDDCILFERGSVE